MKKERPQITLALFIVVGVLIGGLAFWVLLLWKLKPLIVGFMDKVSTMITLPELLITLIVVLGFILLLSFVIHGLSKKGDI